MNARLADDLSRLIRQATGECFVPTEFRACHGGCIHQSGICSDGKRDHFVKINGPEALVMFEAEAKGLRAMAETGALRVPQVIAHGMAAGQAVLVLEALDLDGPASTRGWGLLGEGLARMHRSTSKLHGFESDNFIGSTPQSNKNHECWAGFFIEERLRPQLWLAASKGMNFEGFVAFLEHARNLLDGHEPEASLLHGDLWSGNAAFTSSGEPVVFDPACYYGDRECDLAFTEFFGGFGADFHAAYRQAWPLDDGYEVRRDLYNLYHVLNHANLFGGGYVSQARQMMRSITG